MNPRHLTICLLALTLVLPVGLSESLRTTDPELAPATNATALELDGSVTLQRNGSVIELVETNEPVAPNTAPAGLGGEDSWVDANGDTMFGNLVLDGADILVGDEAIRFTNGELRGTDDGTGLSYGGDRVCTEVLDIPGCGGLTEVSAGPGLLASGSPGSVTLSADYGEVQARVHGSCSPGSVVSAIQEDGSVVCGADQDTDTLDELVCSSGHVAKFDGAAWACAQDLDSPDADTLGGLDAGQFLRSDVDATFTGGTLDLSSGAALRTAGAAQFGGTVSIGTTTPQARLHVTETSSGQPELQINQTSICDGCAPPALQDPILTRTLSDETLSGKLTLRQDGTPMLVARTGADLTAILCQDLRCESTVKRTIDQGVSGSGFGDAEVLTRSSGNPFIVYTDMVNADLKAADCHDPDCVEVTIRTLDAAGDVGFDVGLTLQPDGSPIVSYADEDEVSLAVVSCSDARCTSALKNTHDIGVGGAGSSIAIRADGTPVIAYLGSTHADPNFASLRVADCHDSICAGATIRVLEDTVAASDTSIKLGSQGPIIAYVSAGADQNPSLASCSDPGCTSPDLRVVADVWVQAAALSPVSSPPLLVFRDEATQDLKSARCTDEWCTDTTIRTLLPEERVSVSPSLSWSSIGDLIVYGDQGTGELRLLIDEPDAGRLIARAPNGFTLLTTPDGQVGAELPRGSGSWSAVSDRNTKTALDPVEPTTVLDRITDLPLYEWQYKAQSPDVRHMGPMAQDFYAAFGLGEDERHISQVDADGVALAAIQGLVEEIEQRDERIDELEARLATLEAALHQLVETPEEAS